MLWSNREELRKFHLLQERQRVHRSQLLMLYLPFRNKLRETLLG